MGHDVLPAANWTIGDYPRHLHKGAGEFVIVANDDERDQKLAEGWHLWPWNDWRRQGAAAPADAPVSAPAKKPRGRPRNDATT
jgi:hypothetical protein